MPFTNAIKLEDLPPGECRVAMVGGREVAIVRTETGCFAMLNECPHAGGPLGEGFVEGNTVSCPWHGWKFNVETGACPTSRLRAQTLPTQIVGDWVQVDA